MNKYANTAWFMKLAILHRKNSDALEGKGNPEGVLMARACGDEDEMKQRWLQVPGFRLLELRREHRGAVQARISRDAASVRQDYTESDIDDLFAACNTRRDVVWLCMDLHASGMVGGGDVHIHHMWGTALGGAWRGVCASMSVMMMCKCCCRCRCCWL